MADNANSSTEFSRSNSSHTPALSVDSVFDALANQRRRHVLRCLRKHENPMTLADVADEVAAWENGTDSTDISGAEVERIHTSLYHGHVPKLADAGIVEYSQDRDVVALSENADRLEPVLEFATE